MTELMHVVGARPNFVKMAPVVRALEGRPGVKQQVVHTGQHYDARMSSEMLDDLELPEPDRFLGVGSGTQAEQTAKALVELERVLLERQPDLVLVGGDVNSTLAGALAASKLGIAVAHVEAGLRSFDWDMPEEVNRVLTDRLSDLLFVHSPEAIDNLEREGIGRERVEYAGNTMIDSLRRFEPKARLRAAWRDFGLEEHGYVLVTLHRPSNVDPPEQLAGIVAGLERLAGRAPVLFPVHPRSRARLEQIGGVERLEQAGVRLPGAIGYIDFLSLETGAGAILTDSGGVQEEAAALAVPCFTLRDNTERPVTVTHGTNTLLGADPAAIDRVQPAVPAPAGNGIPLWDGRAGERIADAVLARHARELGVAV
jgi:UDP-N-acetylglucosamine 2-epimerase (non-hydrolysing)